MPLLWHPRHQRRLKHRQWGRCRTHRPAPAQTPLQQWAELHARAQSRRGRFRPLHPKRHHRGHRHAGHGGGCARGGHFLRRLSGLHQCRTRHCWQRFGCLCWLHWVCQRRCQSIRQRAVHSESRLATWFAPLRLPMQLPRPTWLQRRHDDAAALARGSRLRLMALPLALLVCLIPTARLPQPSCGARAFFWASRPRPLGPHRCRESRAGRCRKSSCGLVVGSGNCGFYGRGVYAFFARNVVVKEDLRCQLRH